MPATQTLKNTIAGKPAPTGRINRRWRSCAAKPAASELGLAENTVKVHITAILRKLDCNSRTQAAVMVKALQPEGDKNL